LFVYIQYKIFSKLFVYNTISFQSCYSIIRNSCSWGYVLLENRRCFCEFEKSPPRKSESFCPSWKIQPLLIVFCPSWKFKVFFEKILLNHPGKLDLFHLFTFNPPEYFVIPLKKLLLEKRTPFWKKIVGRFWNLEGWS